MLSELVRQVNWNGFDDYRFSLPISQLTSTHKISKSKGKSCQLPLGSIFIRMRWHTVVSLTAGDTVQHPQWLSEAADTTNPIYTVFCCLSIYVHAYTHTTMIKFTL